MTTDWFRRYRSAGRTRRRLLVLPHAGGSASFFHSWGSAFDDGTELLVARYPGRHDRLTDPLITDMDVLADAVTQALRPWLDLPLTVFGHSMGASLGYEVTLRLQDRYDIRPAALHVSSRKAPHRLTPRSLHLQSDDALIEEVRRLGGTDTTLLEDPDLRALVLPAIRADFTIVGTYGPRPPAAVDCPVHAHAGDHDVSTTPHDMAAWSDVTPYPFTLTTYPGGHFYLLDHPTTLTRAISDHMTPSTNRARPAR
ncbi:thioesterase [Streptomyces sp. CB03234]|uniref:thioesterase II family protein n=1 Tax=Streptomyces sp. (strain CB03234) TaxID=1703937 RepID=UPI00093A958D|nr:thioesterase domain-containing protein [Streptomyces sp. CB03234]OKK04786.1 thioesterase [Streptomyces sp. CB03234]